MKISPTIAALAAALAITSAQAASPQTAIANPQQIACNSAGMDGHDRSAHRLRDADHHRTGGYGMRHRDLRSASLMRELRRLDLSDAQDDAVDAVFVAHHAEQRALFKRRRDVHRGLAQLDPSAKDYTSVSGKLAEQSGQLARDEVLLRTRIAAALVATLTPAQVQQLKTDRAARKARRAERQHGSAPDHAS